MAAPLEGVFVPQPPNPNVAPAAYSSQYLNQANNQLKLYLSLLATNQLEIVKFINTLTDLNLLDKTNFDAFGRLRTSTPLTLFDSQNRFVKDSQFDEALSGSATCTHLANESSVAMNVTTASGDEVVRQSKRVFPYQPGKSLLIMTTFAMAAGATNLRQRVGYFNANNGVFLQQNNNALSLVIRTFTSGSASDSRAIAQADWNGDKLDGSGASGVTLDVTKTQIFFIDLEWLGVGTVRCGFIIDGEYIVAHTFNNANLLSSVYMQTAILPVRYEITTTGTVAAAKTLKQICSTVISEGGYEQKSALNWARMTTAKTSIGTSFVPLVSIRLKSTNLGAIAIPNGYSFMPTSASDYFEIALIKNATLTSASFNSLSTNVEFDVAATALSGGEIVRSDFTSSGVLSGNAINDPSVYNFDSQIGVTIGGTSDIYTLAVRVITGTGDGIGALSYWDLTDP
jgi:hypothetical protein